MTDILFLFGRPGVGKLTVGEHLAAETGYRLLHNHAVVDLVTSLFPFGTPPFVVLRENIWHLSIETALKAKIGGVIMTFAPEETVSDGFIPALQKRVQAGMGSLHFIELTCLQRRAREENRLRATRALRQAARRLQVPKARRGRDLRSPTNANA